jgi:cytosine permease
MIKKGVRSIPHGLPDTHQSVWQLSAIQLSGWTSLPILATSLFVLQENSFYGAVLTIIVGNGILWFLRLAIIAMSYKKRQSTLDISRDYLGNLGSYFIGALLLISTLVWFIAQTTSASSTLTHLISFKENPSIDQFTQMSVLLGIISTFLCMEGIVVLRRLCTIAFPILLVTFFTVIFILPFHLPEQSTATLSLSGLTLVLGTNLGITSDLPTFFRHSRSLQTSIFALTVIQLISLGLALCSLYFGSIITRSFEINDAMVLGSGSDLLRVSLIIFVFLSVICANVANVYSASVGWEVLAPAALVGRKEYLILGLGLTTIFILVANFFSVDFLLNTSDSSLVNLCIVLILGYLISRWMKRPPSPIEQTTYFLAWLLSTIVNTVQFSISGMEEVSPLLVGIAVILLVIFVSFVGTRVFGRTKEKRNYG